MQYSIKQYSGNTNVVRLYILHIVTETCTVHIIHWPCLDFCWGELPDSSPAAASRDGRLQELLGVCCWLASWCSECGVDRRKWHHVWTRPVQWLWGRQQALRYRRWLHRCSIRWLPRTWSLCPALVLRPAVYPDDPASISSTSANWSLLLLTLDFCLSTSEPAVSRHDVSSTSFALCRARW